jgi:hypothetical protein
MESLFKNNQLKFESYPHISDVFHNFTLFSDNSFQFLDGDSIDINTMYKGSYEIMNYQIKFNFLERKDSNSEEKSMNIIHTVNYRLIQEEKDHYNGESVERSTHTLHLDNSPFKFNGEENKIDSQKGNLFNILQDDNYPTIFYTGLEIIKDIDLDYYRMKDLYDNLIEHIKEKEEYPTIFKVKAMEANGIQYLEKYSKITKEMLNQRLLYSVLLYVSQEEIVFTIDKHTLVYVNDKNVYIYPYERPSSRNEDIYKKLKTLDLVKDSKEINERVFNWKNGLFSMTEFRNFNFHSF